MTSVVTWLQTAFSTDDGTRRMVVMDESLADVLPPGHRLVDAAELQAVSGVRDDERGRPRLSAE
jgi:hypothetical protein